ncbi:hypothetical protein FB567DRAFT_533217 [Paraphoma chrysanthemicola]|uniref:DUF6536 domain-containing protein n=1 Tax=Paraphoma chrysanthemicola TaxID=798071 RepID=A0A8K0R153_9PLEO|nr:hypothetical protein FB567DRAFT_533217 [Paraphoma chrysanthemicola]
MDESASRSLLSELKNAKSNETLWVGHLVPGDTPPRAKRGRLGHRFRHTKSYLHLSYLRRRYTGWRGGVLVSLVVCGVALLVNIILTIVAASSWKIEEKIATAFTGDCAVATRQTTVAHFFINVLSSGLLGASNYCMQRLVAPTRKEIDIAHAHKTWLDIGIPSVRNLFHIAPLRVFLWLVLVLSSVPLHFLYNSAVFGTISANVVTFEQSRASGDLTALSWFSREGAMYANITSTLCRERYNAQLITSHGSGWGLLADSSLAQGSPPGDEGIGKFGLVDGYSYCISEITPPHCQVQLSLTIMVIVIVANFVKVGAIAVILLCLDQETIVTIGDAIQSFLKSADSTTQNHCLLSRLNIETQWRSTDRSVTQSWRQRYRPCWYVACSPRRWLVSVLCSLAVIVPASLLVATAQLERVSRTTVGWNGLGVISGDHFLNLELPSGGGSILTSVLIVNSPQILISFMYVLYNGAFTCMLAGREWSQYAIKRASLRVTSPVEGQRSTHFLQLPYSWSIPLLAGSILLHWFVSQSLFLARVAFYKDGEPFMTDFYKNNTRNDTRWVPDVNGSHSLSEFDTHSELSFMHLSGNTFTGIGYSDIALVASFSIVLGLTIVCRVIAGFRTFPRGLPIGGTNSAVISAACHVRYTNEGDKANEDIAEQSLQWGVTIRGGSDRIGHLCFSDGEVRRPEYNHFYAGVGMLE